MAGRDETVRISGRNYAGHLMGDTGPDVVFLHGFGSDRMSWYLNQPDAAAYARTLALDLPGHGKSDTDVGEAHLPDIAERVGDIIEAFDRRRVHIVAHSFGGAVAMMLTHLRPELVASLTLIAPAGLGGRINTGFLNAFVTMTTADEALAALGDLVAKPRLISRQMATRVLQEIERPGGRMALKRIAASLSTIMPIIDPVIAGIGASALPRQVIWGLSDRISPFDEDRVSRLHAELHRVAAAGHVPHMERAAEVNRLIRTLIA